MGRQKYGEGKEQLAIQSKHGGGRVEVLQEF